MVFIHISPPVSSSEKKKMERNKRGKKEIKSRDKITEFSLWRPVPQGQGVAKCDPNHDKGFILITILVF